jgi:hypothetical protein
MRRRWLPVPGRGSRTPAACCRRYVVMKQTVAE